MQPEELRLEALASKSSAKLLFEHHDELLVKLSSTDQRLLVLSICMFYADLAAYIFEYVDVSLYLNDLDVDDYDNESSGEEECFDEEDSEIELTSKLDKFKNKTVARIIDKIIFYHPCELNLMGKVFFGCFQHYDRDEFEAIFRYVFIREPKKQFNHIDQLAVFVLGEINVSYADRKKFIVACEANAKKLYNSQKGYYFEEVHLRKWKGLMLVKRRLEELEGHVVQRGRLPAALLMRIGCEVSSLPVFASKKKKNSKNRRNGAHRKNTTSENFLEAYPDIKALMAYDLTWCQLFKVEHPDSDLRSINYSQFYKQQTTVKQILYKLKSTVERATVKFDREALAKKALNILKELYAQGDLDSAILFAQLGVTFLIKTEKCVQTVHREWQLGLDYLDEIYHQTSRQDHCVALISRLGFLKCSKNLDLSDPNKSNALIGLLYTGELSQYTNGFRMPAKPKTVALNGVHSEASAEYSGDSTDSTEEIQYSPVASVN